MTWNNSADRCRIFAVTRGLRWASFRPQISRFCFRAWWVAGMRGLQGSMAACSRLTAAGRRCISAWTSAVPGPRPCHSSATVKSRSPAQDSAGGIVDACGPKSPDSHRVVWGLTSRPPVPSAGFPPVSRLPAGFFPSSAFLGSPFVRRSPVSLRPLPGSGSPSVPSGFPFP